MKSFSRIVTLVTTMVIPMTPLFAIDIITKKSDGKRVNGSISAMSKTELTLKKNVGEPDVVSANDIAAIEWDGGGPELKLGYSDVNGGNALERRQAGPGQAGVGRSR